MGQHGKKDYLGVYIFLVELTGFILLIACLAGLVIAAWP